MASTARWMASILAAVRMQEDHVNANLIEQTPNYLPSLIPEEAAWAKAVRVIEPVDIPGGRVLRLDADAVRQSAICYFDPN